jgi:hypothetical protein
MTTNNRNQLNQEAKIRTPIVALERKRNDNDLISKE